MWYDMLYLTVQQWLPMQHIWAIIVLLLMCECVACVVVSDNHTTIAVDTESQCDLYNKS